MKKGCKLIISGIIAFSLLNPYPIFAKKPVIKQEVSWYIDYRFDKLYDYIEKNKMDPVDMIKEAFGNNNIICIGEMHDESHREFAIKHLKDLKDVIDYFGVEVSTDYNDKQGRLDYELYTKNHKGIRQELDELAMQKAAIDLGIEVVGLNALKDETIKDNVKKFKDKKILL